jgi:hypothetical protein
MFSENSADELLSRKVILLANPWSQAANLANLEVRVLASGM